MEKIGNDTFVERWNEEVLKVQFTNKYALPIYSCSLYQYIKRGCENNFKNDIN